MSDLSVLFLEAESIYQQYLCQNRKFKYANLLYKKNKAIVAAFKDLDADTSILLDREIKALTLHYQSWFSQWDAAYKFEQPCDNSEFCFESRLRFPKESAAKVISNLGRPCDE